MFSKREAVRKGWEAFKANWKFLLAVYGVVVVMEGLLNNLPDAVPIDYWWLRIILWLAAWIFSLVSILGVTKISIKAIDGEPLVFGDLFAHWRLVPRLFLVQLINGLAVFLPILVLAVGVFVAASGGENGWAVTALGAAVGILGLAALIAVFLRLMFAPYFLVDRGSGAIEAVKASWEATKGQVINLFLFGLLLIGLNLLGLLALVVGVLVTSLVTILAMAYVYRKLSS
jgi:uncharacterized membrane protein